MKLPIEWLEALRNVQEDFPEAVIAGGALRDLLCEKPVKDVDIFIAMRPGYSAEVVRHLLMNRLGSEVTTVIGQQLVEYSDALADVAAVFDVTQVLGDGTPVQVIMVAAETLSLHSVCDRFDFGICRVATNGREDFISPDFVHDLENRVFTCNSFGSAREKRSLARYERLQEKYQGWTLIQPHSELFDWDVLTSR